MKHATIIHMCMTKCGEVNGVHRIMNTLARNTATHEGFHVHCVLFAHGITQNVDVPVQDGYSITYISLPSDLQQFLTDRPRRMAYWHSISKLLGKYILDCASTIVHIHTLNLSELALELKKQYGWKFVAHIHCWPWKSIFNSNRSLFNAMYKRYYEDKIYSPSSLYVFKDYEKLSYTKADKVICVTECMQTFIKNMYPGLHKTVVVENGLDDLAEESYLDRDNRSEYIRCVFVGSGHPAKGLSIFLAAVNNIRHTCSIEVSILGYYSKSTQEYIKSKYRYIPIHFKGQTQPSETLSILQDSDIGVIPSMYEQCSCVAIEMMMAGLPIVATDVDGLSEMFCNLTNARLVPLRKGVNGYMLDLYALGNELSELCNNIDMRLYLGKNARELYLDRFSSNSMTEKTLRIYKSLINEETGF